MQKTSHLNNAEIPALLDRMHKGEILMLYSCRGAQPRLYLNTRGTTAGTVLRKTIINDLLAQKFVEESSKGNNRIYYKLTERGLTIVAHYRSEQETKKPIEAPKAPPMAKASEPTRPNTQGIIETVQEMISHLGLLTTQEIINLGILAFREGEEEKLRRLDAFIK